jgi:hypothetical protein
MTTTTSSSRGLRGLRLAAATAATVLALALPAFAQTYCNKGDNVWNIGNTGYKLRNWTSSGLSSGSWVCSTVMRTWPTVAVKFEWDITNYGFVHRAGLEGIGKPLTQLNTSATATYTMKDIVADRGGAIFGLYGWIWGPDGNSAGLQPDTEFYIIENWFGSGRNNAFGIESTGAVKYGTITQNGEVYDVYFRPWLSVTQPPQWWSIRQTARSSGTINYVAHVNAWRARASTHNKALGITMGRIGVFAEPYGSSNTRGKITYDPFTITAP